MGAGKTTVGKELATSLGVSVIDTDAEIVKREGKSINEIFEQQGESFFRKLEANLLKEMPTDDVIITTGGGIILNKENRNWMKENGLVVYLDADPKEILTRLQNDQSRPLLKQDKQNAIYQLYQQRLPFYEESCHIKISTTGKDVSTIVKEIITRF
jgi:shikimate kinase